MISLIKKSLFWHGIYEEINNSPKENIKPNIPKLNKILNNLIYLISINHLILTIEYELPTIIRDILE